MLAVKQRLNRAALFQVLLSLGGEEPLAEQRLRALEGDALAELAGRLHEDVLDPLRTADEIHLLRTERKDGQVAVFAGGAGEEGEWVLAEGPVRAAREPGLRTGDGRTVRRERRRHAGVILAAITHGPLLAWDPV